MTSSSPPIERRSSIWYRKPNCQPATRKDHSLLKETPERFFDERPQQLRHVISALLRDPRWKDRIAGDAQGPRVGAVGHSAGGYSVLALAGGQPDLSRIARHCGAERAQDPIFCSMGRPAGANPPAAAPTAPNPAKVWLAIVYNGRIITEQNKIDPPSFEIIMNKIKYDNLNKYSQYINGKRRLNPADSLKKNQVFILNENILINHIITRTLQTLSNNFADFIEEKEGNRIF